MEKVFVILALISGMVTFVTFSFEPHIIPLISGATFIISLILASTFSPKPIKR